MKLELAQAFTGFGLYIFHFLLSEFLGMLGLEEIVVFM